MQQPIPIKSTMSRRNYGRFWRLAMAFVLSWIMVALSPRYAKADFTCSSVTEIPIAECQALIALYNSTDGPNWINKGGWLTTNIPCSWYGVTCTSGTTPKQVTYIDLRSNQLRGGIPSEIGNLSSLHTLILYNNQLSSIPVEISNLSTLEHLNLGSNQLSGVPVAIGNLSMLEHLDLSNNQLSSLPVAIGNLTNLEVLFLYENQLSSLPVEIWRLTNLQELGLSLNQLTSVSAEIGNLSRLRELNLAFNQLSSLPAEIGNLSSLHYLGLTQNQLTSVPAEIGNLSSLFYLELGSNRLNSLPAEISALSSLWHLNLSNNQLSNLPAAIGNLHGLFYLNLGNNLLSTLPAEIWNLTSLGHLHLGSNQLSSLPVEIGNLTNLVNLYLFANRSLAGPLPATLLNLTELSGFYFLNTGLCEPRDAEFQSWLSDIPNLQSTGVLCDSEPIFADGFEQGHLGGWSSKITDGGDLAVKAAAALAGRYGMRALIDSNGAISVADEQPAGEAEYHARFYFDPNSTRMAEGDSHVIFYGFSGSGVTRPIMRVQLRFASNVYQVQAGLVTDSGIWRNSHWLTLNDEAHFLELAWQRASHVNANNGTLRFWVDGAQRVGWTGIDNDLWRIERVRLGALAGIDDGTRGTYYFDAFESRRLSYIGPAADAPTIVTAPSISAIDAAELSAFTESSESDPTEAALLEELREQEAREQLPGQELDYHLFLPALDN